jgi:hypothetical protein
MLVHRGTGSVIAVLLVVGFGALVMAGPPDPASVERGRQALLERGFVRTGWKDDTFRKVGKLWGEGAPDPDKDYAAYLAAFNRRYGLHPAPYPNPGPFPGEELPMGLRRGVTRDGKLVGVTVDCMICHGGSIGGKSYVGLGNTQLDFKRLVDEMTRAEGGPRPITTFVVNTARGTVNAGMMGIVLLSMRNPDLSLRKFPLPLGASVPEEDIPPWWYLGVKKTKYREGRTPADSHRANMQFLLGEKSLDELRELEPAFRDIQAYLFSLKPPEYPFPIDRAKAEKGRAVFAKTCAKCHGTYGPDGNCKYPNKVVALDVVGTDPSRARGITEKSVAHFNATWFGALHPADEDPEVIGYQAPPLLGVWATAPYLHNGSVPSLYSLLNSPTRPARFKRPPSTEFEHYDQAHVGWKFETLDSPQSLSPEERPYLYDTSRWGLGNGGHTFGDKLSEGERMEVIEYLKTL